mmetsp:Transcript_65310/g.154270  ORF Transcript_65310/g.154270 Transcript_65310/m.154270 type:complete len:238 (-) Transcript_65310:801-1514(-)
MRKQIGVGPRPRWGGGVRRARPGTAGDSDRRGWGAGAGGAPGVGGDRGGPEALGCCRNQVGPQRELGGRGRHREVGRGQMAGRAVALGQQVQRGLDGLGLGGLVGSRRTADVLPGREVAPCMGQRRTDARRQHAQQQHGQPPPGLAAGLSAGQCGHPTILGGVALGHHPGHAGWLVRHAPRERTHDRVTGPPRSVGLGSPRSAGRRIRGARRRVRQARVGAGGASGAAGPDAGFEGA